MGIPPHAARLAGAWATQSAASPLQSSQTDLRPDLELELGSGAQPSRGSARRPNRDRSHRITARILHPLHRHA